MKKIILNLIKKSINKKLFNYIKTNFEIRKRSKFLIELRDNILNYYQGISLDAETKEVIDYLQSNPVSIFPYDFSKDYLVEDILVYNDDTNGLNYVVHQGKNMYFKRSMSVTSIKSLYRGLLLDQDMNSPHLYLKENFNLTPNDVIADIGSAEGNFSLSNIEKVKKVYLFESDKEWIEALEATFRPWKDKVIIINKYVTNYDSNETLNINSFYENNPDITFFKVDIEGEEQNFLNACSELFESDKNLKIAICTYHKENDFEDFSKQLTDWGFVTEHSRGFMIFLYDPTIKAPFIRRGLIRATKQTIIS